VIASEDVFSALFSLLTPLGPVSGGGSGMFATLTRQLRLVEDVTPQMMPYIGQLQVSATPQNETFGGPSLWTYRAEWYIYANGPSGGGPTTPILNPLVDAVRNIFPQEGGTAAGVTIDSKQCIMAFDGLVEYYEGLLDTKCVAKIPFRLMIPN
jgi:hypothetical protein